MPSDTLFIVSSLSDSDGIFVYRIADADGHLELVRQNQGISNPFFIDLHPNGRVLYSIRAPGNVAAFALDRSSGDLELINEQPTGGGPCHVEVDPSGRMVVAANYTGGSVVSYPLQPDGALKEAGSFVQHTGTSVHERRQTESHAHCFKVSDDGRYAFAADLGTDRIAIYALDPDSGTVTPGAQQFVRVQPGSV